jgi:transposase
VESKEKSLKDRACIPSDPYREWNRQIENPCAICKGRDNKSLCVETESLQRKFNLN